MYRDLIPKIGVTAALLCGSALTAAQADVIGATPAADYSNSPFTIHFGNPSQASYTFSQFLLSPASGTAGGVAGGLSTAGTAQASQSPFSAEVVDAFGPGVTLSGRQAVGGPYAAFPGQSRTLAGSQLDPATGQPDSFLALKFTLSNGVHYGYAQTDGSTLSRYAYETDPGAAIVTGAAITGPIGSQGAAPVPAPPSWAMFGVGLVLLGIGGAVRRRQS